MRFLTPAILVVSLLTLDVNARSRGGRVSDHAVRPAETHSIRALNEIAIAPVSHDPEIHQTNPVVASDGESFLVVWRESSDCCFWIPFGGYSETKGSLYAAALNSRGERLGEPTLLSESAGIGVPGVAFDGTNYVVVWSDLSAFGSDIRFRRLAIDATPVSSPVEIVRVFDKEMTIAVACGEDDCLSVFNGGSALLPKNGGAVRLNGAGGLRNAVIPIETGYAATMTIRNVWTPGPVMPPFPPTDENNIAEFSLEGTLSGPYEFGLYRGYADERIGSTLAGNGSSVLIAAVDSNHERSRDSNPPLYVLPVREKISSATFTPKLFVDVGTIDGRQPSIHDPRIIWTGTGFLLVYQRTNESFGDSFTRRAATGADVWGVLVEPDGSAVSGPPFELTSTDEFEALPSIAANAHGLMALAFVRGRGGEDSPNPRLFVQLLSDNERSRRRPARPSGQSVTLSAEKTGAGKVLVRLGNGSMAPVYYSLCPVSIDRRVGDTWEDITSPAYICPAILLSLGPGKSDSVARPIIEVTEPGTYRFRTPVSRPGCDRPCAEVVSNSLELP